MSLLLDQTPAWPGSVGAVAATVVSAVSTTTVPRKARLAGGTAASWDEWARRWWRTHASVRGIQSPGQGDQFAYLARERALLLRPLDLAAGQTLVEVGSTYGLLAYGAADLIGETGTAICVVLEPASWALTRSALADERFGLPSTGVVRFMRANSDALPLPTGSADAISLRGQLCRLPPASALDLVAECARLLRPGGRLALVEPLPAGVRWRAAAGTPPMPEGVRRLHHRLRRWQRQDAANAPVLPREGQLGVGIGPWRPTTPSLLAALSQCGLTTDRIRGGEQVLGEATTAAQILDWCRGHGGLGDCCPFTRLAGDPLAKRPLDRVPAEDLAQYLGYWLAAVQHGPVRSVVPLVYAWGTRITGTC